ncbi:MAG: tetratricopeptide repeat protein [Rivularia sp. (in: cyanobacteria)]
MTNENWQGINIKGGTNEIKDNIFNLHQTEKPIEPIKYLPKQGTPNFIGREQEFSTIHNHLQQNNSVAISALSGMGGVGKTELAICYARQHENDYPGGICWINAKSSNPAAEIIQRFQLHHPNLKIPQEINGKPLNIKEQLDWCWQNWQPSTGRFLLIFDDITNLGYLPLILPTNNRFRVLLTTRIRNLDANIQEIPIDVLPADKALELLTKLIGKSRIQRDLETASQLCERLGYLPLGVELVGRYLREQPDLSLTEMLGRLRLEDEALQYQSGYLSTAQLGVKAAFELTWQQLDIMTQHMGMFLSLFAQAVIPWQFLESGTSPLTSFGGDEEKISRVKNKLFKLHLIQPVETKSACYKIHPLIREFLQQKLNQLKDKNQYKRSFCENLIEIAKRIPQSLTLEDIKSVEDAIPHLKEIVENYLDAVSDENLYSVFDGFGRFYFGQGLYALAQPWYQQSVSVVKSRLGVNHPDTATSLNNLANLYLHQGKYEQAEPLYIQTLELRKQFFGENHPNYAESLNNLALLYHSQGKYEQAEPLYIQALDLRKQFFSENHPNYAESLNNLAVLYLTQGKYKQAEPLCIQALDLRKQLLGVNHPNYAESLNNLALIYESQRRYKQAELFYIQALKLRKQLLGVNHPKTATSLNNLAIFYDRQGKYKQAESLYIQALELIKQLLGENHPFTANSLNNLALLYFNQGKYEQAEPLYIQALEIAERVLGKNHPNTVTFRENFEYLRRKQQ